MINSTLMSALNDNNKVREASITTKVEVTPTRLMSSLAEGIYAEILRLVPYSGYTPVEDLESGDILKYLKTLVWLRVQYVNHATSKALMEYKPLHRSLEVPVLAYQLLIAIGEAYDADYSIRFVPEYSAEGTELLSPKEMVAISNLFLSLRMNGFASVTGMPRETEGELAFMALSHVEDVVCGYRNDHPVYGFLAAFFCQQELNQVTGTMCRIIYGYDTDYELMIRGIMAKMSANPVEG